MTRRAILFLIRLYQIYLSPRKGFSCAHAAVHGGLSCSSAVAQIIASDGVWHGLRPIEQRFIECRSAAHFIQQQTPKAMRGAVDRDCGLSSCVDVPSFGSCSGGADAATDSAAGCSLIDGLVLFLEAIGLRRLLLIVLLVLAAAGAIYAYAYGSTVEAVSVTRTSNATVEELGLIDRMLSGREVRYFMTLENANGQQVDTEAISGDFAQGIVFHPLEDIRIGQIETLILKRKQALKSESLLNVAMGADHAGIDDYSIVVRTNWPVFQRELK
jgi:putative component of membrane protein insertase Oxa1/YidC/SpoIIIJ protein YidD